MQKNLLTKTFIAALALAIAFTSQSCKKKDNTPPPANNSTTTGGTPADGSVSTASVYSGIFTTVLNTSMSGTVTNTNPTAFVWFGSSPSQYANLSNSVKVGQLRLNGDTLWYYTPSKEYYTWGSVNLATESWSVNGANGIPSFSISVNAVQPSCSNYTVIPDSISKSAGFNISINNVSNATSASLLVSDGTNTFNGEYVVNLSNGNNNINVSPANLSNLTTGNNLAEIAITLYNNKAFVFGGKDFQFSRSTQYYKNVKIKN